MSSHPGPGAAGTAFAARVVGAASQRLGGGNLPIRAAMLYTASNALQRGVTLLLTPVILANLTLQEYGTYALLQTITAVGPALLSLGLYSAVARFYFDSADPETRRRTVSGILLLLVAVVVTTVGASHLAAEALWRGSAGISLTLLDLTLTAAGASALYEGALAYMRAAERPRVVASANLVSVAITAVAIWYSLAVARAGLQGLLVGLLVAQGLSGAGALLVVIAEAGIHFSTSLAGAALAYAIPLIPHVMSGWLLRSSDRWILDHFRGPTEVGAYFLGIQLTSVISLVMFSANDAISPRLLAAFRDHGQAGAREFHARAFPVFAAVAAGLGVTIALAGPAAARLLSHGRVTHVAATIAIISAAMVALALYVPFANAFFALKETRRLLTFTMLSAGLDLALNLVAIPRWGAGGAAASMLVSYCVLLALVARYGARRMSFDRFPAVIAGSAAAVAAAGVLAVWIYGW